MVGSFRLFTSNSVSKRQVALAKLPCRKADRALFLTRLHDHSNYFLVRFRTQREPSYNLPMDTAKHSVVPKDHQDPDTTGRSSGGKFLKRLKALTSRSRSRPGKNHNPATQNIGSARDGSPGTGSAFEPPTPNASQQEQSAPPDERRSYWKRALEDLKEKNPEAYNRFSGLRENLGTEVNIALESYLAQSDRKDSLKQSRAWRLYQRCVRGILQYKELAVAAASFDPHKIAPIVLNGICVLLQARLPPTEYPRLNLTSLGQRRRWQSQ